MSTQAKQLPSGPASATGSNGLSITEEAPQAFLSRGFQQHDWNVITKQLFPEAKDPNAILLLLDYCKVRKLDPMQKVFHIVPMKKNGKDVDTILPGVAYYEIVAHRTGQFAGKEPAEYGPVKKFVYKEKFYDQASRAYKFSGKEVVIDAPEWAIVRVKKIVQGVVCEFASDPIYYQEFASIAKSTGLPNDNWRNKPRMMMGKCALAGALRVAFPEEIGNEATAEEMEGREIYTSDAEPMPENTRDLTKDPATQALAAAGRKNRTTKKEEPAAQQEAEGPGEETVDAEVSEVKEEDKLPTQAEVAQAKADPADPNRIITAEEWAQVINAGHPKGWLSVDISRLSAKQFKVDQDAAAFITVKQAAMLKNVVKKYGPEILGGAQ